MYECQSQDTMIKAENDLSIGLAPELNRAPEADRVHATIGQYIEIGAHRRKAIDILYSQQKKG